MNLNSDLKNSARAHVILDEIASAGHISTTNDAFAKKLFSHKEILIDFLNSILQREGDNLISDLVYTDTEQHAENSYEKISRLDICCQLVSGVQIDIEVQVSNDLAWIGRSLFYWSKLYAGSLVKGDSYSELKPVICINLMKFNIFKDESKKQPHTTAKICNIKDGEPITNLLELHFLELQKFKKKSLSEMSRAEKWLAYFSGKLSKREESAMLHDNILGKAINIRNEFMKDPDNYAAYLNREMEILDYKSMMKQERSEGREEGREEGRAEGREEGRVEGRAEGRIEERLDNIKNLMINKKFTVEEALSALGIPEENWDSIKSKIK